MMDSLKKLELEYDGIKNTILDYTSEGTVINFIDGLQRQIRQNDMESIIYYLNEICHWYAENIENIHHNEFVIDSSVHDRNKKILEELYNTLSQENEGTCGDIKKGKTVYTKIFLSHSSSNKKYGDALRELFMSLGLNKEQLIYTSHPLHKIPAGDNIFEYLKKNITRDIFVIFLWSNEYLKSAACLNEMGAAWISESDYINIYTPDFDFNNPQYNNCAVDTKKMGIILRDDEQCKIGITELKNKFALQFKLNLDEREWIYHLDQFIKNIL